jgi:hypothetical protein
MELDESLRQRALASVQALKEGKIIKVTKPKQVDDEVEPSKPQPKAVPLPESKIRTNDELRKSILELQDAIPLAKGQTRLTKTKVMQMNKQDLERTLGDLTNQALEYNKTRGVPVEEPLFEVVKQADGTEVTQPIPKVDNKTAAQALFHFNFIVVKVAELASINLKMKDKVGSDLEGLSDDIMKDRKDLERILERIANDHGPQIAKYLTPINEYGLFMLGAASNRLIANKKKTGLLESTEKLPAENALPIS